MILCYAQQATGDPGPAAANLKLKILDICTRIYPELRL
jgi:hypothetical protein